MTAIAPKRPVSSKAGASVNVSAPSGGLSANSYLVVPSLAYSLSLSVTAIDGWAKAGTGYHYGAGTLKPQLSQGVSTATVFDGSDYVTVDYSKIGPVCEGCKLVLLRYF